MTINLKTKTYLYQQFQLCALCYNRYLLQTDKLFIWNFVVLFVFWFRVSWLAANHSLMWQRSTPVTVQNRNTFTRNYNTGVTLNICGSGWVCGPVIAQSLQWPRYKLQAQAIVPFPVWVSHYCGVCPPQSPDLLCVLGTLFTGVKLPGYTADYSPPSCVVVTNERSCTCTTRICLPSPYPQWPHFVP